MTSLAHIARRGALALLLTGLTAFASAHPGHHDPISKEQAIQTATQEISRLAQDGKVDKSWVQEGKLQSAEKRTNGKAQEWVVTFANATVADAGKKTLYVFLSESGEYIAANFTGS